MPKIDELLRGVAETLEPKSDGLTLTIRKAARRRNRRRIGVVALGFLVATVGIATPLALLGHLGRTSPVQTHPPVSSAPTGLSPTTAPTRSSTRCAFPTYEVTYLPWVPPGSAIPRPDEVLGPRDAATLYWSKPRSHQLESVRLTAQSSTLAGGPGEEVPPLTGAGPGQLYEGEAPGSDIIFWQAGSDPCGEVALELVDKDLNRSEAHDAILQVAASLRRPHVRPRS